MAASPIRGYLCVIAAAVLWASSGTAGKGLFRGGMTPFELVQVRITLSALLLAAVLGLCFRKLLRIRRGDVAYFFLLGAGAMASVQITYFYTISKIQVAAAILIQYLSPFIVAVFSICFWKERLTFPKILSLLLSIGGCCLVVGGYNLHLLEMNKVGLIWGLASAFCFAGYTLLGEKAMHRYSPWTVLFYALLFAAVTWNTVYRPFKFLWTGHSLEQWTWMGYISVMRGSFP